MGVTGLWKLIDSCGNPVPVETLEGKVLAVDISIWLHQVIKGFQDHKGAALNNAHLLGLFHRLCKLLYYRVKPVFVFDGCVPQLKKDTIARRQQQRNKFNNEAERIQALLLQNLAQEQVVQEALGPNAANLLLTSPLKRLAANKCQKEDNTDDMFKLPDISKNNEKNEEVSLEVGEYTSCTSNDDSSFDEGNARHNYNTNLQAVDVRSQHFRNLPAEVRHEILIDIKETRKQSSWGRLHELPSRSDDFSLFQMKRLLKRRDVQVSLEEAEKDMGGRSLTYAELNDLFTEDGILESSAVDKKSTQLCSDEHTRFLLVKDLKKKLSQEVQKDCEEKLPKSRISKDMPPTNGDLEFENDLEMAVALSLADTTTKVYDEKDYEYESDESLKLTKLQRQQLKGATKGPARTYMIEYAGMNKEEVSDMLEKTQMDSSILTEFSLTKDDSPQKGNKRVIPNNERVIPTEQTPDSKGSGERYENDDHDTDSDLEEVVDTVGKPEGGLSIVLNVNETLQLDKDLFADVFQSAEGNAENFIEQKTSQKSNEAEAMTEADNVQSGTVQNTATIRAISNQLQQQLHDIKSIQLDDIIVQLSDEDLPTGPSNEHIIEICDDTPSSTTTVKSTNADSKTPPKSAQITDFFKIDYVVKRTPDKPKPEEPPVPKVSSPFFVKKTPNSVGKNMSKAPSPQEKSKVNKKLFVADNGDDAAKDQMVENSQEILSRTVECLRAENTNCDLQTLAKDLAQDRQDLENMRNRQERMGMSITQRMSSECQQLLRLFGIPYIVAPTEAEAQCAFLDIVQLTQGTITDDSDIWLFGGRTVYKNFFAQNKHVMEFRADQIETKFNCDRNKLIQLACLVGSDYTTGIHGIGTVTALEILAQFSTNKNNDVSNNDAASTILSALQKFHNWWHSVKTCAAPHQCTSARLALQKKLKNIELYDGFPNTAVIETYLTPTVDHSTDSFTWGLPDLVAIREFARQNFGWSQEKTDNIMKPVMKKLNEKKIQASMRNYLTIQGAASPKQLRVSKRVKKAIEKMSAMNNSDNDDDKAAKPIKAKRVKKNNTTARSSGNCATQKRHVSNTKPDIVTASTRERGPMSLHSKEIIPQREKDLAQMKANRILAAEVLKKSAQSSKRPQ